ncbi:hypothetical protein CB1_001073062 [Camelus ferus]|nr:hypothetical protein CB1_001073062 [Camelus ferus]
MRGLRFWLVIKEDQHMVTARQEPRLVLVSITYEDDHFILRAPGMDQLVLPSKLPSSNTLRDCRVFGLDIKGRDCGDEAAQWFTNFLKTEAFRLVQFESNMKGRSSKKIFPFVQNYQVAYPDCSPIMVLSEASLADLNTRLEKKVKMSQFRPNIVVTGCDAFEEDTWDELLIGNVEMKKVLSCPRCIMTTVDPDTGVMDRKEPLETLKRRFVWAPFCLLVALWLLVNVGTVAQLCIYPIKSCSGVSVSAAECTALGLRSGHLRDRFWMVINKVGNMVTARQEPRLVLISPTCEGDTLTLSAAYTKDLRLPIQTPITNAVHKCRVHGLEIEGRDCGEAAAQWITSFLKTQPYRLVHFEPHMRPRNSHQIEDVFLPTDQIVYADACPFLILSEASLADLNSRLEKKVKATNFRPNILISGCGVYAEDSWDELLIGDVELKRVMACSRVSFCSSEREEDFCLKREAPMTPRISE